ncbi:hypothetical protein [Paractinoplanes durhamensis]|uniref:hypothetical protein n=1 Tax=Paractinoplanes durhamensis TaxID=113563 RepID=UPI0019444B06|nr:hypothetical protein [Actinoplanes durhamensis]
MDLVARWRRRPGRVLFVVIIVAGAAVWLLGFWQYAQHDRIELIDLPVVADRADEACTTMRAAVAVSAAPAGSGVEARVRTVRAQDAAVAVMVARVRELGPEKLADDHPAASWLADWEDLVAVREKYADDLAAGRAVSLQVPVTDGVPITRRMDEVGLLCRVPAQLVTPG